MIHGMGGLGKSSLAKCLLERTGSIPLVLVGTLDEIEITRILRLDIISM